MLSDSLLAELLRNRRPQDDYVAREDFKIVIQDIDDFNQLRTPSEKITKLHRNAGADILDYRRGKAGQLRATGIYTLSRDQCEQSRDSCDHRLVSPSV